MAHSDADRFRAETQCEHECCDRIRPPPSEHSVESERGKRERGERGCGEREDRVTSQRRAPKPCRDAKLPRPKPGQERNREARENGSEDGLLGVRSLRKRAYC